jgi:hypothetical protein
MRDGGENLRDMGFTLYGADDWRIGTDYIQLLIVTIVTVFTFFLCIENLILSSNPCTLRTFCFVSPLI